MESSLPLQSDSRPLRVIAHRCLGFNAPANSAAALRAALASSVDEVELDFRHSRDGLFFASHFPWYRAARGGYRRVAAGAAAELRADGLLSLSEALQIFAEHGATKRLRLELKSKGAEEFLLQEVAKYSVADRVRIVAWHGETLRRFRRLDPTVELSYSFLMGTQSGGLLPFGRPYALPSLLQDKALSIASVNIVPSIVPPTRAFVSALHYHGIEALLVTSYGLWNREQVAALGVDGVLTSQPSSFMPINQPA